VDGKSTELCEVLEWDTAFWGFRVARVRGERLDPTTVAEIHEWCRRNDIRCLYFLGRVDDAVSTGLAEDNGFRLVDVRVEFHRSTGTARTGYFARTSPGSPVIVRFARSEDYQALQSIARTSYRDTRFYYDGNFPRHLCDLLYETWIRRSCEGYADLVLVAELGNEVVGYISCHLDDASKAGRVGLVGVSHRAQGKGIGSMLVSRAVAWFEARGARDVYVVTQGRNYGAQRLYQRSGFVTHTVRLWYHKWYEAAEDKGE
jgi:dTDP-4-amino-4,6-dideoxy-D-galactose acyltransferase